jgi:hypothetical protein
MSQKYKLFWGDSHTNLHSRHLEDLETSLQWAHEMLDFWPLAYYPQARRQISGFSFEDWLEEQRIDAEWKTICNFAAQNNRPGKLIIFAGYEWQGDGRWGDHNVFYLYDYQPVIRVNTLPELYREIRRRRIKAFVIPHHTAYMVGIRGKNWNVHDEELSPFAEIYSQHGCSESDEEWIGLRFNQHMGPSVSGGTIEEALNRGIKLGVICSGDSHYGFPGVYQHGLMACYAKELTREALWEAFGARRVYGVTGDRIELLFTVEGAMMGSVIQKKGAVRIETKVRGGDAIDRIELLRNNRVIATHCHNGTWTIPRGNKRIRCKLCLEVGWGPLPSDIPDQPPREWEGSIEIPNGWIVSVEKRWRNFGQYVEKTKERQCNFRFLTQQRSGPYLLPSEATVFELEGKPSDKVNLELESKSLSFTLEEAMQKSRIIFFREEVENYVQKVHKLEPKLLPRDDPFYFLSHKAKLHRAIPEVGYTAEFVHTDISPPDETNFYRVRVSQRNGNLAWSSPIWVENI